MNVDAVFRTSVDTKPYWPGKFGYKLFYLAFNLFILYIPLNSFFEIRDFISGNLTSWSVSRTPLIIKLIKDGILICNLILILPVLHRLLKPRLYFLYFFIAILLLYSFLSVFKLPVNIILMGIRGNWVIVYIFVGFVFKEFELKKISNVFLFVFILHFIMQLIEMLYAPPIYSGKVFGLFNARNPGIFMVPSNAGAFSLTAYMIFKEMKWKFWKIIAIVSMVLSNNTTALLIYLIYKSIRIIKKIRYWYFLIPLLMIAGFLFIINIGTISGRGAGAHESFFTRVHIIQRAVGDLEIFLYGKGFGLATSTAVVSQIPGAIISDNTMVGLLFNTGFLGVFAFCIILIISFKKLDSLLFLIFIGFALTTVVMELNPVIQIIFVILGSQIALNSNKIEIVK